MFLFFTLYMPKITTHLMHISNNILSCWGQNPQTSFIIWPQYSYHAHPSSKQFQGLAPLQQQNIRQIIVPKIYTYKVAWIHNTIFNWMCAVYCVFQGRFLLLTSTCSNTFTSTLGRYLGSLLCCWFLYLKCQQTININTYTTDITATAVLSHWKSQC